ncbi:hypothetical protein JCM5350_006303 [Sporobolomyces pararoseus]
MAPIERARSLPDFHLHVLRLNERGSQLVFEHVNIYQVLKESSQRVLESLYPRALPHSRSPAIRSISLFLKQQDGVAETHSSELDDEHKEVVLSTSYLENVYVQSGGDLQRLINEIEGVLTHELVHAFQYDGSRTVPGGVIEGIADWVRHAHGLGPPHWREGPTAEERWDAGYQTTAYFLVWLEKRFDNPLLVPRLNMMMLTENWDDGKHFEKLLNGQDVEKLWEIYKQSFDKVSDDAPPAIPTHSVGYRPAYA